MAEASVLDWMTKEPYFSIIVPTLNRVSTLRECLRTISLQDFDDYEVVVSDNCSNDSTREVVESVSGGFSALRYVRPPKRLSMSRHWEFAFSQSKGRYVCYVGDDDGIMVGGLKAAFDIIQDHGFPLALNSVNAEYHWPNSPIPYHQSIIRVPVGAATLCQRNSKKMLELLRMNLRLYVDLPMVYRGFVRRDVLHSVSEETGALFRSSIPDVYAAVAVAASIPHYLFTNIPLFVEGLSGASNGASCLWGSCDFDKEFFVEDSIPFHSDLNFCGTEAYLHAESLLQCRDAGLLQEADMMKPVDLIAHAAIGARGLVQERHDQVWDAIIETAGKAGLLSAADELRMEYPNAPLSIDPFPASTVWSDVRGAYEPALAIRSDRFGCESVLGCVELIKDWVGGSVLGGSCSRRLARELGESYVGLERSSASAIYCESLVNSLRQQKAELRQKKGELRRLGRELSAMREAYNRAGVVKRILRKLWN